MSGFTEHPTCRLQLRHYHKLETDPSAMIGAYESEQQRRWVVIRQSGGETVNSLLWPPVPGNNKNNPLFVEALAKIVKSLEFEQENAEHLVELSDGFSVYFFNGEAFLPESIVGSSTNIQAGWYPLAFLQQEFISPVQQELIEDLPEG